MGKGKRLREARASTPVLVSQKGGIGVDESWFYIIRYAAIVSMFIDHLGRVLYLTGSIGATPYLVCYVIGRVAFPLFVFELVESFYVTKKRGKHLLRIGILALVSEVPFDMVSTIPDPPEFSEYALSIQNVCFTLFFGFLMILIIDKVDGLLTHLLRKHTVIIRSLSVIVRIVLAGIFGIIAALLSTDFSWHGIVLIALFAFARTSKLVQFWQGVAMLWFGFEYGGSLILFIPLLTSLALIYVAEIKSRRPVIKDKQNVLTSKASKWFCRLFYPVHLALLGTFRALLMGWRLW